MKYEKQVEKAHYEFARYVSKERWSSVWHQLDEIQKLRPRNVLEVGPGPGLLKALGLLFNISIETLDLDPELNPDHIGSVTSLPFADNSYDIVCAFQVLEHLPYEQSCRAFAEMARVSRGNVVISLPDARIVWPYRLYLPKLGLINFFIPRPTLHPRVHKFDGEHYWEVNKKDYSLARVEGDFGKYAKLVKSYRVSDNPYHRFFIFNA